MRFDPMNFTEWWDKNGMDSMSDADFTYGEEVWQAARRDVWSNVFQVVSDNPQIATREFIKKLEALRDEAGCGPSVEVIPMLSNGEGR